MKSIQLLIRTMGVIFVIVFLFLTWNWFNKEELVSHLRTLAHHPMWLIFMFAVYYFSFVLKAAAWRMYEGTGERLQLYIHGMMYSLLVNHVSPLKIGDIVRTGFMMKTARKSWDQAFHSVAVMRLLDLLVLGVFAGVGILWIGLSSSWLWMSVITAAALLLFIGYRIPAVKRWPFIRKHLTTINAVMLSPKGYFIVALITASWILEAAVIYGVAHILSIQIGIASLVWANSITIAGQVFHITPGGIGTYESTLSGSLYLLGVSWKEAYAAAFLSHTFKFAFSYAAGGYSLIRMPIRLREIKTWITQRKLPEKGMEHS